jgi:hypothetical protein
MKESNWTAIHRIADEIRLQIHLASLDTRDRWKALEPRLDKLRVKVGETGKRLGHAIDEEMAAIADALEKLRTELGETRP